MEDNHYKTLGVPSDADEKEIRSAYRNLAKKFHPDTGEGSSAERFHAVQAAYEVLSDPEKRRRYDIRRRPQVGEIPVYGVWSPGVQGFGSARGFPTHLDLRSMTGSRRAEPISSPPRNRQAQWNDPFEEFDALFRGLLEDFLF